MTRLFIYRMTNFQFFVINFSLISTISFIFGAKKSSAKLNPPPQNRQSSPVLSKQTDERADDKPSESLLNRRLTVNENDFINPSRAFQTRPTKSRKTLIDSPLILPAMTCKFRHPFSKPSFRLQNFPSQISIINNSIDKLSNKSVNKDK